MKITNSNYQKSMLSNGIRVVSEKIPHVRSVSLGVWLIVGSRDENVENNGISHYIEHMLFKGTNKRKAQEIAESLESVGGHLNAFTAKELTCYYAHILDEHLTIAIDVISDILKNSIFDRDEMEKEKQVIVEEINNIEETPEDMVHDLFQNNLFPNHSLGLSIVGSRENVLNFKRENLLDYIDKNYTSNRIVIAAAGNVVHSQLVGLAEKKFAEFKSSAEPNYPNPTQPLKLRNIFENGGIQAHLCLGTHSYSYRNPKKFGLLVLNTLLGSGMSSRLFQNIREKYGLAYSIYSYIDFLFDTGLFGVYVGTDRNKLDSSIELISKELDKLRKNRVSAADLNRTKSQLKGNLMLGLESTSSRMNRLAKMEIYLQKYYTLDDTLLEIERVSSDDLLEIANELFDPNRICYTILQPHKGKGLQEGGIYDHWNSKRN
ncbi:MAG: M16 family metallopeptidase [bacterium]